QMGPDAREAVPALAAALRDKDGETRCLAADALGRMGEHAKPAVAALAGILKDGEAGAPPGAGPGKPGRRARGARPRPARGPKGAEVRGYAAQTLAQLGALQTLTKALDDKDEDVRVEVVLVLRLIGRPAVPALVRALKDKSADVRMNTAATLGKMGANAADAV